MKNPIDFETELAALINKHSMENAFNTPNFILARYLCDCLSVISTVTKARDKWYGIDHEPGEFQPAIPPTAGQFRIERGELGENQ